MKKNMLIMLGLTGLFFGGVFGYNIFQSKMAAAYMKSHKAPAVIISALPVTLEPWEQKITAPTSLRAVNGVDITTEIAGLIKAIHFKPGTSIEANDLILELNTDTEIAQLHSLEATLKLAEITYQRDKKLFASKSLSRADLDTAEATLKKNTADRNQQLALIGKKTIRAPFKGHLGISAVNLGQYLNPGDKIVTLQALDPIFADFSVPQQKLPDLKKNQSVTFKSDTYPSRSFSGKITSINPKIDPSTRNVQVEATLSNTTHNLFPGMYGEIEVTVGKPKPYLTVPQTAISYNPYGDIVYTLKEQGKDLQGKPVFIATQKFVTVGDTRADQVQVVKGLKEGDQVVVAGQHKLKNGSLVTIDNKVLPPNNPSVNLNNEGS